MPDRSSGVSSPEPRDEEEGRISAESLQASVVIPTHGRRRSLLRVLKELGRQSTPPSTFEVIVVCDGDVDGTVEACRELARHVPYTLRVLEQANQGPAAARNNGVQSARAPLILFLDDDVVPAENWIATHLHAQAGQERLVAVGPLLPPSDFRLNAWGAWEERALLRQYAAITDGRQVVTYRQFYTGNASALKRHIIEAGGFDASYRRAEDVELGMRLSGRGLQFKFLPDARAWHYVSRPFEAWLRMAAAYGSADVALARANRPEMLVHVWFHFHVRNPAVRMAARLCAGRHTVVRWGVSLLGMVIQLADAMRATWLATRMCSLVFNLQYYDGVANELGGNSLFRDLMSKRSEELWAAPRHASRYVVELLATTTTA